MRFRRVAGAHRETEAPESRTSGASAPQCAPATLPLVSPPSTGGLRGGVCRPGARNHESSSRDCPQTRRPRSVTFTSREGCIRANRVNRESFSPAIDTVYRSRTEAGEKMAVGRMRGAHGTSHVASVLVLPSPRPPRPSPTAVLIGEQRFPVGERECCDGWLVVDQREPPAEG